MAAEAAADLVEQRSRRAAVGARRLRAAGWDRRAPTSRVPADVGRGSRRGPDQRREVEPEFLYRPEQSLVLAFTETHLEPEGGIRKRIERDARLHPDVIKFLERGCGESALS